MSRQRNSSLVAASTLLVSSMMQNSSLATPAPQESLETSSPPETQARDRDESLSIPNNRPLSSHTVSITPESNSNIRFSTDTIHPISTNNNTDNIPTHSNEIESEEESSLSAQGTGNAADLTITPQFYVDFSTGEAGETDLGGVTAFFPLIQTPGQSMTYLSGTARYTFEEDVSGTIALGHRFLTGDALFGGYLSYDLRNTSTSTFNQIGAGLEAFWNNWDFHLNGYVPIGNTVNQSTATTITSTTTTTTPGGETATTTVAGTPFFGGNNLFIPTNNATTGGTTTVTTQQQNVGITERAMAGIDAEVGVKFFDMEDGGYVRGVGGLYYLSANGGGNTFGGSLGLDIRPNRRLGFGISAQHDDLFGTNLVFSINASLSPSFTPSPETDPEAEETVEEDNASLWVENAAAPLNRRSTIAVAKTQESLGAPIITNVTTTNTNGGTGGTTTTADVIAINPATGNPYIFRHVNPDNGGNDANNGAVTTSLETILGATNLAVAGDIIYVQNSGTPFDEDFTAPAGVQILSTAQATDLLTQLGSFNLPGSGTGIEPSITGSVTLNQGSSISGFQLNGGVQLGGDNVTLENLTISANGAGQTGILADNVTNAIIRNTNVTAIGGATGVSFLNLDTVTFDNNMVAATGGGIGLNLENISGVNNLTGNTIESNGSRALSATNIVGDVTLTNGSLTSTNSPDDGILIDNVSGRLAVSDAAIAISGATDDGIQINNNGGTVDVMAAAGSTIANVTDHGIEVTGAGNNTISGLSITGAGNAGFFGNLLTNLNLSNNAIEQAQNQGIFLQNSDGTFNITNNSITNIQGSTTPITVIPGLQITPGQGIALAQVTGTVNVSSNQITGTANNGNGTIGDAANPLDDNGQGISLANLQDTVDLTIDNNIIDNNYNDAILLGFGPTAQTTAINVRGNSLTNNGSATGDVRGDGIAISLINEDLIEGILGADLFTGDTHVINGVLIDNNTIAGNGDEGIDIRAGNGGNLEQSILTGTISNNRIGVLADGVTASGNGGVGINIEGDGNNRTGGTFTLSIIENIVNNNGSGGMNFFTDDAFKIFLPALSNNTINANSGRGISITTFSDSIVSALMDGNTFNGGNNPDVRANANSGRSQLCLSLTNNISDNDFNLDVGNGSLFLTGGTTATETANPGVSNFNFDVGITAGDLSNCQPIQ